MPKHTCLLTIWFFTLFIISCGQKDSSKQSEMQILDVHLDTIERYIPDWYSKDTRIQDRAQKAHDMLGLKSLYEGFDSLQIRIWIECWLDYSNIISISKSKGKWKAIFHYFKFRLDESGGLNSVRHWKDQKTPKSGWKIFIDTLLRTNIMELLDYSEFKPYGFYGTDMEGVGVEISSAKIYRLYEYPELPSHLNIKEGPAKLEEALALIEREFKFKRWCE